MEASSFDLRFVGTRDELARWARFFDENELLLVLSAPADQRDALWRDWTAAAQHEDPTARTVEPPIPERHSFSRDDAAAHHALLAWLAESILREARNYSMDRAWTTHQDQAVRNAYERARFLTDYRQISAETVR